MTRTYVAPLAVLLVAATALPSAEPTLLEQAQARGRVRQVVRPDYLHYDSLGERWVQSDVVVRGRVVDQAVRLSDDGRTVWTDYTIEVLTGFKPTKGGLAPGMKLVARAEGGNVVVEGRPIAVVNELFPPIPWVREHVFMLKRSGRQEGSYDFLDGPRTVLRRDDAAKVRCLLPKEEWDFLCTSYNGTSWTELLRELKKKE